MSKYVLRKNGEVLYEGTNFQVVYGLIPEEASTSTGKEPDTEYTLSNAYALARGNIVISHMKNVVVGPDGTLKGRKSKIDNEDQEYAFVLLPKQDLELLLKEEK
ncbi:hypothetical protein HYX19_02240 [Candidatus Woesearchaeota archaeon]|nr:hypothetical protein [Candidatus Woesearchaeota archaeon]